MRKSHLLLKVGAVALALILVGGFVSYRAGAFNWLLANEEPAADETYALQLVDEDGNPVEIDPNEWAKVDTTFMSSSKSIAPLIVEPGKKMIVYKRATPKK